MKKFALASALAAMMLAAPVAAQTVTIKFISPAPPTSPLNHQVFYPWAKKVSAESGGALNIKMFGPSMATFRNIYDRITDRVAEIGFALTAPIGGKFPQADVASLPFLSETSGEASMALWRLYTSGVMAKEFSDIHLLALFTFPQAVLHSKKKPIWTLEDIKGHKMRSGGRLMSRIVTALGASPVTLRPTEIYQSTSRGVVDSIVLQWTGFNAFKIIEVTKYHMDAPLGASSAMVFMNKDAYAGLSGKARQAVDKNAGVPFVKWIGDHLDGVMNATRAKTKKTKGHVVRTITPAEKKRWVTRLKPIAATWVKVAPDGVRVLKAFKAEVANIRAGK